MAKVGIAIHLKGGAGRIIQEISPNNKNLGDALRVMEHSPLNTVGDVVLGVHDPDGKLTCIVNRSDIAAVVLVHGQEESPIAVPKRPGVIGG